MLHLLSSLPEEEKVFVSWQLLLLLSLHSLHQSLSWSQVSSLRSSSHVCPQGPFKMTAIPR